MKRHEYLRQSGRAYAECQRRLEAEKGEKAILKTIWLVQTRPTLNN